MLCHYDIWFQIAVYFVFLYHLMTNSISNRFVKPYMELINTNEWIAVLPNFNACSTVTISALYVAISKQCVLNHNENIQTHNVIYFN
jgi:hypothetical protein